MPSQFVQECLNVFDVASGSDAQSNQSSTGRKVCELVAIGLEQGRHSAIAHQNILSDSTSYLIPALLHEGPVVIASASEQSIQRHAKAAQSLPRLAGSVAASIRPKLQTGAVQVLLPREVYLCRHKVQSNARAIRRSLSRQERAKFFDWATRTSTGTRDEAPFRVTNATWHEASVPDERCQHLDCAYWNTCHTEKAKERAKAARVVLTTHAYYSRLRSRPNAFDLPSHDRVIVDNAADFAAVVASLESKAKQTFSRATTRAAPSNEIQDLVATIADVAQTHLTQALGNARYVSDDPLATSQLYGEPDLEDWLRHAKERLRSAVTSYLMGVSANSVSDDPHALPPSCRHQLTDLATLLAQLRHQTSPYRWRSIPNELQRDDGLARYFRNCASSEASATVERIEEVTESLADDLQTAWGAAFYSLLDPLRHSTVARWERGHFWIQHARAALRQSQLDFHPSYFTTVHDDESTDVRNSYISTLDRMLQAHRLAMIADITANLKSSLMDNHRGAVSESNSATRTLTLNSDMSPQEKGSLASAESEIQSALLKMQTAVPQAIKPSILDSFDAMHSSTDNFLGIYGTYDEWCVWSTALRIERLRALDHSVGHLADSEIDSSHGVLLAVGRALLALLDVLQLSVGDLSPPGDAFGPSSDHIATISGSAARPLISFSKLGYFPEDNLGYRLRREFRRSIADFHHLMPSNPTRPIFLSSQIPSEVAASLGAYDNALPHVVD